MKKVAYLSLITALVFSNGSVFAGPILLGSGSDDYIGAIVVGPNQSGFAYKDVVGSSKIFDLTGWSVYLDGAADTLTVNITGKYFPNVIAGTTRGTIMGDLFITTGDLAWTTTEESKSDNAFSIPATSWDYVVRLGTYSNAGGALSGKAVQTGNVFQLGPNDSVLLSDAFFTPALNTYRSGQEVMVGQVTSAPLTNASWFISSEDELLSITIHNFSDVFGGVAKLGFHWTMSCANDVIEFVAVVPEPSTIGLLGGLGLVGLLLARRRLMVRRKA